MKHIKAYKIFEEAEESHDEFNKEIQDTLLDVIDYGLKVKIYDYYHNPFSGYLFLNKGSIHEDTHNVKLIKLTGRVDDTEGISIDDFSKLGFNSSGFTFMTGDFNKIKDFYFELLNSISHFNEYHPKLWISADSVMILLDIGKVSESDIGIGNKIKETYQKLADLLESASSKRKHGEKIEVTYWEDVNHLKIHSNVNTLYEAMAGLCHQLSNENRYSWMRDQKVPQDIKDIADEINKDGFNISFKSDDHSDDGNSIVLILNKI